MDLSIATARALAWAQAVLVNEWTGIQIIVVALGFAISTLLARRIEPLFEAKARNIRGNPDLLRVVIAFLRRLRWLFLVLWLGVAQAVLQRQISEEHRWLVNAALILSAAWLAASVLTRVIRNFDENSRNGNMDLHCTLRPGAGWTDLRST